VQSSSRGVGIVICASCSGSGSVVPDDVHLVIRLVIWGLSHAEESQRTRTGDVELFSIVSGLDQNGIRIVVVRYAEDGTLNARKVTRWSDNQSVLRAAFQLRVARLLT